MNRIGNQVNGMNQQYECNSEIVPTPVDNLVSNVLKPAAEELAKKTPIF